MTTFIIFMPPRPRPAGDIERLGCPYVHTSVRPKTRLRILAKVESQDLLLVAS